MQETWVRSLGQEDPLEKEMATHSSILAWKISWMAPSRLQSMGRKESDTTERLHFTFNQECTYNARDTGLIPGLGRYTGEGIGYPLQCSWTSL